MIEMKKTGLTSFMILCFLSIIFLRGLAFEVQPVRAEPKTWIVDDDGPADFHTIQEAINNANEGDTIFVHNGTYYENAVVNKTISLIGEKRSATIIDGGGIGTVVYVSADYVTISEFTVQNGNMQPWNSSVCLNHSDGCNIINNSITKTMIGVRLESSNYNVVSGNNITDTIWGIWLGGWGGGSSNNTISRNNIRDSEGLGIGLSGSLNNVVSENDISNSEDSAIYLQVFSNSNRIQRNKMTECFDGVTLSESSNTTISENAIANSDGAFVFDFTSNNNIYGNNITNGDIYFYAVTDNKFFHNNFVDVDTIRIESAYANVWDDGYPSGGNYWSDYDGSDLCSGPYQNETGYDWIGDSPYVINGSNQDNYPLMGLFVAEKEEMKIAYRNLLLKHSKLFSNFEILNAAYDELLGDFTDLQGKYDSLQGQIFSLNSTCIDRIDALNSTLQTFINAWQEQVDSLNSSLTRQEAITSQLSFARDMIYIFIATTIFFIITTILFAIRKPKTKP